MAEPADRGDAARVPEAEPTTPHVPGAAAAPTTVPRAAASTERKRGKGDASR
jgi:hypothetical protein